MIFRGFRGSNNLPWITAVVFTKKPKVTGPVAFVLDTAATTSAICDVDARRLGINLSELKSNTMNIRGIGGVKKILFLRGASIMFVDEKRRETYSVSVPRLSVIEHVMGFPSLLGIDVLHRFSISMRRNSVFLKIGDEPGKKR